MLKYGEFYRNGTFLGENGTLAGRVQKRQLFVCFFIGFELHFGENDGNHMRISGNMIFS